MRQLIPPAAAFMLSANLPIRTGKAREKPAFQAELRSKGYLL
jgi:hypothetical protein